MNAEGWRLLREIAEEADGVSRKAIIIAEQLPNDPAVTRSTDEGGAGHDAQWNDLLHDNLRRALGDASFGDPDMGSIAVGMNHFDLPGPKAVNYIESHDEAAHQGRVSVLADGSNPSSEYAYGRAKFAAATVLFAAGIPMLLQGQEFLESRKFGDAPEDRIRWSRARDNDDFLLFMKDAIRLRRTQPALRSDAAQNVFHVNDGANVIAFHRWTPGGRDLVVVISLANGHFDDYELGFPLDGEWFEVLNGDAAVYGGENRGNGGRIEANGPGRDGFAHSAAITVPRMGVLAFAREPIDVVDPPAVGFIRSDCNGDGGADISDAVRALGVLFLGEAEVDCVASCDSNADASLDISDAIYLLSFLFTGGERPDAPWPRCGEAESPLGCARQCAGE